MARKKAGSEPTRTLAVQELLLQDETGKTCARFSASAGRTRIEVLAPRRRGASTRRLLIEAGEDDLRLEIPDSKGQPALSIDVRPKTRLNISLTAKTYRDRPPLGTTLTPSSMHFVDDHAVVSLLGFDRDGAPRLHVATKVTDR